MFDMSNTRKQLENYLGDIKVSGKVLDIGGSQLPIRGRIKCSEAEFTILDLEQPHECKQKPDLTCDLNDDIRTGRGVLDKDNYLIQPIKGEEEFDYAFCIEVSEYWWNPVQSLKNINNFLKKDGILFISFHFLYPVHQPTKEDCLRYTPEGAKKLLEKTGFKIKNVTPRFIEESESFIEESESNKALWKFWGNEKMRPSKDYNEHHLTGVLIEAQKC